MSQHDYTIANQGFPATRADINNALSAIATNNSGTSAPSTQYAGQFWIDTTSSTWTLYIHDGTDDIQFATIDTSANTVNFTDSALDVVTDTTPQLGGNLDLNSNDITGTGDINITGNITASGNLTSTGIDDNATSTAITIDSSERVGIGLTNPAYKLDIFGNQPSIQLKDDGATNQCTVLANAADTFASLTLSRSGGNASTVKLQAEGNNGYLQFGSTLFVKQASSNLTFETASTERMRIDSSGNVGIGTSSPSGTLEVRGSASDTSQLYISTSTKPNSRIGYIGLNRFGMDIYDGLQVRDVSASYATRFVIDSSGNVLVGKTTTAFSTGGNVLYPNGTADFIADGDVAIDINRLSSDGDLIRFYQAGSQEGSISVSGSTVSYNGFTGTHWSRFTDNSKPTILRGTVLESLDEMCDWYNLEFDVTTTTQDEDGNDVTNTHTEKVPYVLADGQSEGDVITYNHEGTDVQATIVKETDIKHVKSKVSDTVDAKNVYGVFVAWDEDGEGYNDFYVASVGSFVVRIKQGETIAKGDLLQSNGDGTAKVQSDDAVRASSFAKVLSTTIIETYEDGSYLVPCSLMC